MSDDEFEGMGSGLTENMYPLVEIDAMDHFNMVMLVQSRMAYSGSAIYGLTVAIYSLAVWQGMKVTALLSSFQTDRLLSLVVAMLLVGFLEYLFMEHQKVLNGSYRSKNTSDHLSWLRRRELINSGKVHELWSQSDPPDDSEEEMVIRVKSHYDNTSKLMVRIRVVVLVVVPIVIAVVFKIVYSILDAVPEGVIS